MGARVAVEAMMPATLLQAGDAVEMLPATAPPLGQPAAPITYGTIITVDQATGRATVRLPGRRYPIDVPHMSHCSSSLRWTMARAWAWRAGTVR
jgi:hypothetical protein